LNFPLLVAFLTLKLGDITRDKCKSHTCLWAVKNEQILIRKKLSPVREWVGICQGEGTEFWVLKQRNSSEH
jgi:hypothetical protein